MVGVRKFGVRFVSHPLAVRVDEEGQPRTKLAPYRPRVGACRICPARCCRLLVKVSLVDALRYSQTLGVPFFSGLTVVASEHPQHAFRLDADPRWVEDPGRWPGRAELALRRRADGGCHALVRIGDYERCGVYAARPSPCRTYPVTWKADTAEGGPQAILCPVPYGITDDEANLFEREIEWSIEAWELHDDVVAEWNRGEGPYSLEAFITFVVPRIAPEARIEAPDALAAGTASERLGRALRESGIVKTIPGVSYAPPRMEAGIPVNSEPRNLAIED